MKMRQKRFRDWNLTTKIASIISAMLVLVFVAFIAVAAVNTGSNLNDAVYAQLDAVASQNAAQVQAVFDSVSLVGNGVQDYMDREYEASAKGNSRDDMDVQFYSPVFRVPVTQSSYEVELYLQETFRNAVTGNDSVNSIANSSIPLSVRQGD